MSPLVRSATPIDETDWPDSTMCMSESCHAVAEMEFELSHEGDDRTYWSCLCRECGASYTKSWDEERIFD